MTLPWPPSVNSYWRHPTKGPLAGRHLISEDGRRFRSSVERTLLTVQAGCLSTPCRIVIHAFPPDRRKRDLDNILKSLLDAITHAGVVADDSLFDDIHIIRRPPGKPGHVDIFIAPLENT